MQNREEFLEVVKRNGSALEFATTEQQNDKEIVLEAVKDNGYALFFASKELRNDKEVVLEAAKQDGWSFRYASLELRNDKDLVLAAVKQNRTSILFASDMIKTLVGDSDPVETLTKAVQSEKLAAKLSSQLKPKSEKIEKSLKI